MTSSADIAEGARPIRLLRLNDAKAAVSILEEAVEWTARLGFPIWQDESFEIAEHQTIAIAEQLVGGFEDDRLVACMRLQAHDGLFWPDDRPGDALYVHKLAVRRSDAGQGWTRRMLAFAVAKAALLSIPYVRLDTYPLPQMIRLYENEGFVLVDPYARDFAGRMMVRLERRIRSGSGDTNDAGPA